MSGIPDMAPARDPAQVRELPRLEPERRSQVWQEAVETYGPRVTAAQVRSVVETGCVGGPYTQRDHGKRAEPQPLHVPSVAKPAAASSHGWRAAARGSWHRARHHWAAPSDCPWRRRTGEHASGAQSGLAAGCLMCQGSAAHWSVHATRRRKPGAGPPGVRARRCRPGDCGSVR